MDFITGEKLELFCDAYIGTKQNLNFLPSVSANKNKHLYIEEFGISLINNPKVIFIHGQLLDPFVKFNCIDFFANPFILVVHNSDENITDKYLQFISSSKKLIHLFAQNLIISHPKTSYIPIGIANSVWKHGNLSILQNVIDKNINKTNDVFFNFSIKTNPQKRQLCYDIIASKGINWIKDQDYENYLTTLASYKFCISPDGNGIDCCRVWEALYLNVVPICLKSPFYEMLAKDFPIMLLDKWEDFNIAELNYDNYKFDSSVKEKLNLKFYLDKIKNTK